jgi:hypothetical protein
MIWPELDQWKDKFGTQPGQIDDLAAMCLVNLLFYLREVILQDSCIFRELFPDHVMWNHPVFQHEAYPLFCKTVQQGEQKNLPEPSQLDKIVQAIPQLADYLESHETRNETRHEKREIQIQTILNQQAQQLQHLALQLQPLLMGQLVFRLDTTAAVSRPIIPPLSGSLPLNTSVVPTPLPLTTILPRNSSENSLPTPAHTLSLGSSSLALSTLQTQQQQQLSTAIALAATSSAAIASASASASANLEPPRHQMCRQIKTVQSLWQEWTKGLAGQPSIRELDSRWGSRWRSSRRGEIQWYSLRREIIQEIERRAKSSSRSEEAAMWSLHFEQERERCSIDQLCKRLRKQRVIRI